MDPGRGHRRWSGAAQGAVLLVVVALLTLSSVAFVSSPRAATASVARPSALSTAALERGPSIPLAGPIGKTVKTLVLFNNTVFPGNDYNVTEGMSPQGLAYDSKDGTVWVSATASNAVGEINVSTGLGIRWLPADYEPWGLAYDNLSDRLFVVEDSSDNVTVLNATSGAVVGDVHVGVAPQAAVFDWRTGDVYVANYNSANVSVIHASTLKVEANVTVGNRPVSLTYDGAARAVVVANEIGNSLSFVAEGNRSVVKTVPLPGPLALAYDAADGVVFVSNVSGITSVGAVSGTVGSHISGTLVADALALDPSIDTLYTAEGSFSGFGTVQVIAAGSETLVTSVPMGLHAYPFALVYDAAVERIAVANANDAYSASYNVTEIDPRSNTSVATTGLQHLPIAEAYSALHHEVYLYDGGTGDVYAVNDSTDTVVRSAFVGYSPSGVGCPGVYVCQGLAYDPVHDTIFADYYSYTHYGISAVNASTFAVTNVTSGGGASRASAGIAVDTLDHEAFVANYDTSNVTVVNTSDDAVEGTVNVGLEPWGVTYDPGNDRVYVSNSASGTVSVIAGGNLTVIDTVTVAGIPQDMAYDPDNGDVYVANAYATNNLTAIDTLSDRNVANISLHATGTPEAVAVDPTLGEVEVTLSGPPGALSVVNDSSQGWVGLVSDGTTAIGGGVVYDPAVDRSFVTGYFPGTVSVVRLGSVASPTYQVSFTESGLPGGTTWGVHINGADNTSTGSSIGLPIPNGSYAFSVLSVSGYTPNASGGTIHVRGHATSWAIVFAPASARHYSVTFTEGGLPFGTSWTVTLNGTPMSSSTSSIVFTQINGSYSFTVSTVAGYTSNVTSGSVVVAGAAVGWTIAFTAVPPSRYTVTFSETGLPSGTTWSVTLQGSTMSSSTSSIQFLEPNGTYAYTVGSVAGWVATPASGHPVVGGAPVSVSVTFAASPPPPGASFLGLPGNDGYYALVGIAAALAIGGIVVLSRRRRGPSAETPATPAGSTPPPPSLPT